MSAVADPPSETVAAATDGGVPVSGPDLNRLQDRTPKWMRFSRGACGWVALLGLLYLLLSYQPLYHTDLWGHLSYGRWIWEQGRLPQTEPLLPLSTGMPMVDTAWLSQVIGYGLYRQFGVTALQFLYAAPITLVFALLLWGVLRRSGGSIVTGLVAIATFGWVNYQQLLIVRPQLNGLLMFVTLFVLLNACRWRRMFWVVVPLMFALWANLHGSWIVGLGLLATMCGGRAIDVARRTKSLSAPFADDVVRRLFVLGELAALAVLANPYGFGVYPEVFAISANPNLQSLIEWEPLTLRMSQGKAAATAVLALMFAYRCSPRRVSTTEMLLLAGLGAAALWSSRMLHWWAPLAAWYLALHAGAIARRWWPRRRVAPQRTGLMGAVTVGLVWICFAYTPFGYTLLHGQPGEAHARVRQLARSTSPQTPLSAIGHLREHPLDGLIYNSYEWGDFLLFAGPTGIELFTNSHAHLIPRDVWEDALNILQADSGWEDRLDLYGVEALVLNAQTSQTLIRALKREKQTWEVVFEDQLAVIVRRRST